MRRKHRTGYLMLAILVISGLAGTVTDNSLNKRERKFSTELLKSTKAAVYESFKRMNPEQMTVKFLANEMSECGYFLRLVHTEKMIRQILEKTMNNVANPEKRNEISISDDDIIQLVNSGNFNFDLLEHGLSGDPEFKSVGEAILDFKNSRINLIRYIKSTTEDLRNHVALTPWGWMDCYQLSLLIPASNYYYLELIRNLKTAN